MTENVEIYRQLQEHLDKMPIGFPKAKSGSDIRLLKHLFTPEEAKIAMLLRFGWFRDVEPLETIYERAKDTGLSINELEQILERMVKKGSIMYKTEGDKKYYGNALLMVGMFEFQVNKLTKEFVEDLHQYWKEGLLMEMGTTQISQMRIIPVEESITPEHGIATYEDIKEIIKNAEGPFGLVNCVCSQGEALIGNPCKFTKRIERCLGWGDTLGPYLQLGWAREISKEEVFEVLRKNQEEGLPTVLGYCKDCSHSYGKSGKHQRATR